MRAGTERAHRGHLVHGQSSEVMGSLTAVEAAVSAHHNRGRIPGL
jgi:hypothetical protein